MRRILWLSSLALLVFLFAAAIVYVTNPLSARTWLLGKALQSPVGTIRSAAERKLAAGDPEEAAEAFVDAHASGDLDDGSYWRFSLLPPEAAGKLSEMLDDPDPSRAAAAADGLAALAESNKDHDFSAVLPALVRALDRRNADLGWSAAAAGSRIGPRNPEIVKAILRNARNGNALVLSYLRSMELNEADVSAILDCLADEDSKLRKTAIVVLGSLAPHKGQVVPALSALLESDEGPLVKVALYSLWRLQPGDPATIRKAIDLLERDDARRAAIDLLSRSTASPEALAAIKAGLRESSTAREFLEVAAVSNQFEALSPELIPELLALCRGTDLDQRMTAIRVLADMGPAARSAVPAIEEILSKESDPTFSDEARIALESMKASEPAPPDG